MDEFHKMTAVQLHTAIQAKQISIMELTLYYLDRIQKYDTPLGLNTIAELNPAALDQARAMDRQWDNRDLPLFGLPILVKDNIDVAGLHTTAGSLALSDNIASKDAPVIANLKRNGAIILGKTNMTEFANFTTQGMANGYSSKGGQVRNAYDPAKDPSGSSTGSAVAMSAGFCAAAVGTDTSFSVVGCATENGVVGLKPAFGSLSNQGIIPISHTLDSAGALTRDLSDAILLYSGMRDTPLKEILPANPQRIHIGVNTFRQDKVSEAQLTRYSNLFDALQQAGVSLTQVSHPNVPEMGKVMLYEFKHDLEKYLATSTARRKTLREIVDHYEANPHTMMKYGISKLREALDTTSGQLNDRPYLEAMRTRENLRRQMLAALSKYDACVMTGPVNIFHFMGLPSVALNLCMGSDNTPRGIILYGADEQRLLAAALTIEKFCQRVTPPYL